MMMAHVELLSFWHSLQQLQSSEELGVKVEKFASRAFDDLVSVLGCLVCWQLDCRWSCRV